MSHQDQSVSRDDQHASQQAPSAMRALTTEELREIVGGPEIQNGGTSPGIVSNVVGPAGG